MATEQPKNWGDEPEEITNPPLAEKPGVLSSEEEEAYDKKEENQEANIKASRKNNDPLHPENLKKDANRRKN